MPRARKGAARTQARRRLLREARGYYGTKSRHKQQAKVALLRAGRNAWRHRRLRRYTQTLPLELFHFLQQILDLQFQHHQLMFVLILPPHHLLQTRQNFLLR